MKNSHHPLQYWDAVVVVICLLKNSILIYDDFPKNTHIYTHNTMIKKKKMKMKMNNNNKNPPFIQLSTHRHTQKHIEDLLIRNHKRSFILLLV